MDADVVVVGAGPTGLLLAGDLATAGVRVLVVEKRPSELSNLTRAFAVHARSSEVLDARGLADQLVKTGQPVSRVRLFDRLEIDLDLLPTRFPFVLVTPQYEVERLLRRRAEEAGATFRHDTEVTWLHQDDDGVTVGVTSPDGPGTLRVAYLVGADGVRSVVRASVGAPFPGHTVISAMVLADVRLATRPPDVLTVASRAGALGFLAPFGDGRYRFIGWDGDHDVDAPVTDDEIRRIARSTLGTDYGMHDVTFASRFAADERQAPQYRYGRVLLAGDAAHVHSPAGGLGMNTGLQDAANLGWKLAAVVHGADAAVLDTYQAERHPVGRQVLRASGTILRLATRPGPVVAAARRAVVAVVSRSAPVRRRAAGQVSAIAVAYPRPRGSHRLVGRRAPDLALVPGPRGDRLAEALRTGRFVLVLPRPSADSEALTARPPVTPGELSAADRVVVHRADDDPTALLVRPDGYIASAFSANEQVRRGG
jgi:2-polyprenyl-6-methoxyphenol hydroxylase-like FAD-dependent oxidoreductase